MTTQTAKNISIIEFLASQGIKEQTTKGNSYYFKSPFRNETKASFKVDNLLNLWFDYGLGVGGSIIDLVCNLQKTDVKGALLLLGQKEIKLHEKPLQKNETKKVNYHIQKLQHKALIQYLELHRKIPFPLAERYLQEAYYKDKADQKQAHFALAFKNDSGGYELRNIFQKRSTGNYYTLLKGINTGDRINVFEGFMDFLSALVYYNKTRLKIDTLVLNSIANKKNALEVLGNYKTINLFLDNDSAGTATKEFFQKELTGIEIIDYSKIIYPTTKDFNQFLILQNGITE